MKWFEWDSPWFLRKNVQTDVSFWGQYQVPPVEIRTQHRRFRDDITGVSGKQIDFNNKDSHPYNLIRKPFLSKTLYVGVLIIDQVIRNSTSKFWRVNGYHLLVLSFLRECFEAILCSHMNMFSSVSVYLLIYLANTGPRVGESDWSSACAGPTIRRVRQVFCQTGSQ